MPSAARYRTSTTDRKPYPNIRAARVRKRLRPSWSEVGQVAGSLPRDGVGGPDVLQVVEEQEAGVGRADAVLEAEGRQVDLALLEAQPELADRQVERRRRRGSG